MFFYSNLHENQRFVISLFMYMAGQAAASTLYAEAIVT